MNIDDFEKPAVVDLLLPGAGIVSQATSQPAAGKFALAISTSDEAPFWPGFCLSILGAPGKGKTHLMATASAHYPEVWPPTSPVEISDVLSINTDQNGLAPFREAGVAFKHVIDISEATSDDCFKLITTLPTFLAAELKKRPEVKVVCLDHASGFFEMVLFNIIKKSAKEGPAIYNQFAKVGKDFFQGMREKVKVPLVYNFHIKPPKMHLEMMSGGAGAENYTKSTSLAAGKTRDQADYAIGGSQLSDVIRNTMTLSAYLTVTDLPGDNKQRDLVFVDHDVYTKKRLTLCVGDREPAHLGKLLDKISAAVNSPWR